MTAWVEAITKFIPSLENFSNFFTKITPIFNVAAGIFGIGYEIIKQNETADRMEQQRRDQADALKVVQDERKAGIAEEQKRYNALEAQTEEEGRRIAGEEANLATQQNLIREKFIDNRSGTIKEIEDDIKQKTDYLYERIDDQFEGRKEKINEDTNRAMQRVRHNPRQIENIQSGKQNQLNQVEQEKLSAQRDLSLQVSGQAEQIFSGMQKDAYNALNASGTLADRKDATGKFLLGSRQGFIQQATAAADKILQMEIGGIQIQSQSIQQGEAIRAQGYHNPFYTGKKIAKTLADDIGKLQVGTTPSWQSQAIDEAIDKGVNLNKTQEGNFLSTGLNEDGTTFAANPNHSPYTDAQNTTISDSQHESDPSPNHYEAPGGKKEPRPW